MRQLFSLFVLLITFILGTAFMAVPDYFGVEETVPTLLGLISSKTDVYFYIPFVEMKVTPATAVWMLCTHIGMFFYTYVLWMDAVNFVRFKQVLNYVIRFHTIEFILKYNSVWYIIQNDPDNKMDDAFISSKIITCIILSYYLYKEYRELDQGQLKLAY